MIRTRFVYVLLAKNINRVKIGISSDPKHRMNQLKYGSAIAVDLELVFARRLAHADARLCESALHRYFAKYRLYGEWFSISADEAVDAVRLMAGKFVQPPPPIVRPRRRKSNVYRVKGVSLARRATLLDAE